MLSGYKGNRDTNTISSQVNGLGGISKEQALFCGSSMSSVFLERQSLQKD